MFSIVAILTSITCTAITCNSQLLSVLRQPGHDFLVSNFTLTSRNQVLSRCEDLDKWDQLSVSRNVSEDDDRTCERFGNATYWQGSICLQPGFCPSRNFTCCSKGSLQNQEYGVASMNGEIELCKAADDGWRTRLNVNVLNEVSAADLNIVEGVQYRIADQPLFFPKSQRYRIEIESEISSLGSQQFKDLKLAFNRYCSSAENNCAGRRQASKEQQTGSFGCFAAPAYLSDDASIREWLEQSFPILRIQIGDPKNTLCVSPWSYFVPVDNFVCVGIVESLKSVQVIGANLLEGHTLRFEGPGQLRVEPVDHYLCIVSRLCVSSRKPQVSTGSPSKSPSRSLFEKPEDVITESPQIFDEGLGTAAPTKRPTKRNRKSLPSGGEASEENEKTSAPMTDESSVSPNANGDDTDISPLIWFGVGSGLTFLLNCLLLLYCRCCRSASVQPKFTRLGGDGVEMSAPASIVQVTTIPSTPSAPQPKPTLSAIINSAAAPFEQSPVLAGGAAAFERAWNQGLIVDVWGITLKTWQQGVVIDSLTRLRLLRVASGTVSGVEKMYWIAKQRPVSLSSPEVLGMIEISVDLTSKRLSAVFKMSRSAGGSSSRDSQHLHALFDAFKQVVEEVLC